VLTDRRGAMPAPLLDLVPNLHLRQPKFARRRGGAGATRRGWMVNA
jgi:hypothetical protein